MTPRKTTLDSLRTLSLEGVGEWSKLQTTAKKALSSLFVFVPWAVPLISINFEIG
jgi:hypothetical protein